MTPPNLISRERAKYNLPSATTSDDRTIDALLAAASGAVQRWCKRVFALARYDDVLDGTDGPRLMLREYPVQSIESVRYAPQVVLEVTNTDTSTSQQARVTVTRDGLELVRVASGTLARDTTVTFASNATLQALASAVVALGNGWSARADADFALWPSQDLHRAPAAGDALQSQGALDCRGRWAGLRLHTSELADYSWDTRGWLTRGCGQTPWLSGVGYWRVQYTAGYAQIPEDIQEACASWTAVLFEQTKRDPSLATQALPGSISQTWTQPSFYPPKRIAALLAPYRRAWV